MGRRKGGGWQIEEKNILGKGNMPLECFQPNGGTAFAIALLIKALWKSPILLFGSIKLFNYPRGRGCPSLSDTLGLLIKIE